jgi:hypothetical protein
MTGRYKHESRQFILRFEDLPGLEVVMRPISVGKLMDMAGMADGVKSGKASETDTLELFRLFAGRLVSWNLDGDDDKPVPADLDGVRSLDTDLFMQIFEGWFEGMTSAPKAPRTPSPNGSAAGLPMETLGAP